MGMNNLDNGDYSLENCLLSASTTDPHMKEVQIMIRK